MQTIHIRHNVFETNSSSTHSLTLSADDVVAQPFGTEILKAGILSLEKGDYGWEYYRYYKTEHKAQYLLTQIFSDDIPAGECAQQVTAELRAQNSYFDMLCSVVEEHTGVKVQVQPGSDGQIDHDSSGVGMEMFNSREKLHQFLFNPNSFVETSNDNSGPGQTIDTDRGPEHYYGQAYREPEPSWVSFNLYCDNDHGVSFTTIDGIEVSDDINSSVYNLVKQCASLQSVHIELQSAFNPYSNRSAMNSKMSALSDLGVFFSEHLTVDVNYTKLGRRGDGSEVSWTTYAFLAPKDIVSKVNALTFSDPLPACQN